MKGACVVAALLLLVTVLSACDPCTGVSLCGTAFVSYDGRVLSNADGSAIQNVGVTVSRVSGIAVDPATIDLRTDSLGIFRIRLKADAAGEVVVRIALGGAGTPQSSSTVREQPLRTTRSNGNVLWLGDWRL